MGGVSIRPLAPPVPPDVSVALTLPTVSDTVKCAFKWSDGVGHFGARVFFTGGNPPFTTPDLNGFASAIATAWKNNMAQDVQNLFALVEVDLLDISTHNGLIGTWTGSWQGSDGTVQLASNLCVNIETQITHHYRGGHPVLHHPPGNQTRLQGNRSWNPTYTAGVQTHWQAFITSCAAFSSTTVSGMGHEVLLGYRAGNTSAQVSSWTPIGYRVPTAIGSMRRRLRTEA
jgi:hypothetical protein